MHAIPFIFDIQKFSTHDGPGIRTTIFLKGCSLACLWCSNPESKSPQKEILISKDKCIRCGQCVNVCNYNAISLKDNTITLDRKKCSACGSCIDVCFSETLKMAGKAYTVEAVMKEILGDESFYRTSGGGVTFSGGEALLFPEFVKAVAMKCKEKNIHTAIETAGCVPWENFEMVSDAIDLYLFDIKMSDETQHEKFCGKSNKLILENLDRLNKAVSHTHSEIIVRIPIIPGVNDDEDTLHQIAECLKSKNKVSKIELLPYHDFGKSKYDKLDEHYLCRDAQIPTREQLEKISDRFKLEGLDTEIK